MGRTYFVDDAVGQYLSTLNTKGKPFLTGLFVGQSSSQKDYVILATQTPPMQDVGEEAPINKKGSLQQDGQSEEWAAEHARQVSRMLPGGLTVIGVFIVTPTELTKEVQALLQRLVFAVEKAVMKGKLWAAGEEDVSDRVALHICSTTKKFVCRTYDVRDHKCSPKPADWKYQNGVSASWPCVECAISVDIHIPVSEVSTSQTLEKNIQNGLARWAKQVNQSVCLINGQLKCEDSELLEGQKKNVRGSGHHSAPTFVVQLLKPMPQTSEERSTAAVQVCSSSINLKGAVFCRAYLHTNKPKVKDAIQALKRDVCNTISSRCEMLFEDLLMSESSSTSGAEKEFHGLPKRVFVPLTGSSVMFCDYMFGDELAADIQERFSEMLDYDTDDLQLDMSKEEVADPDAFKNSEGEKEELKNVVTDQSKISKIRQNVGVALAAAVTLVAVAFSVLSFSD
ncbi:protein odr-4 homolog [Protopterus annectens]|uniref:protein odr-4 homolog n=1 Tax=Protopterus annectens TaxID=7888 RepID=UPI001CFAAAEB|nr:protein odr-4 homolog [Protopterus annectens]